MTPARGSSPTPSAASQPRIHAQQPAINANQYRGPLQQGARWRVPPTSQPTGQANLGAQGAAGVSVQAHPHHAGSQQYPRMTLTQAFNIQNPAAARLRLMNEMRHPAVQPPAFHNPDGSQRRPSPAPGQHGLSDLQVQNLLRSADAREAINTITNAMERSASGASLGPLSGRATPNSASRTPSGGTIASGPPNSGASEVYILNSPQGPRALVYNRGSETYYYTPTPARPTRPPMSLPDSFNHLLFPTQNTVAGDGVPQRSATPQAGDPHNSQGLRLRRAPGREVRDQPAQAAPVRPHNAGAAAQLARIWPHFWLAVRLALFVWWFTSPQSSWSRWFTVIAIAVAIFVVNTGILDGYAEQVWRIICRHMENLIPLAEPNNIRNGPAAPRATTVAEPPGQNGPPDPGRAAARLVEQRQRANASWLMDQVRRVERAGLLFLASIAPGVAERHIAHLEAEAERQRQAAEAAAEEARRAAEAAAEAPAAGTGGETEADDFSGEKTTGNGNGQASTGGET